MNEVISEDIDMEREDTDEVHSMCSNETTMDESESDNERGHRNSVGVMVIDDDSSRSDSAEDPDAIFIHIPWLYLPPDKIATTGTINTTNRTTYL